MLGLLVMPRRLVSAAASVAMLVVLMGVTRSAGADLEESLCLRYRAPASCPDRATFLAQVAERTSRARWVESCDRVREFDVRLDVSSVGASGTLTIRTPGGPSAFRRIDGRGCDEVVTALGLVSALAIDPKAKTTLPAAGARATPAPAATEPRQPQTAPRVMPAPSRSAPRGDKTLQPEAVPEPTSAPQPDEPWRWTVGVLPHAASGLGSALGFVMLAYVDLAWLREDLVSPSFRFSASYSPRRVFEVAEGRAEIQRVAGHLSGCPLRWAPVDALALVPCVGVEAGVLHGSGDLAPVSDDVALWLAAGAGARLQWWPFDWSVVELSGELVVPVVRPRFFFEPDATIVATDPVLGTVGGGAGIRFP